MTELKNQESRQPVRRRTLLLALLLASLIGLLYARPSWRHDAGATAARATHAVLLIAGMSPRDVYVWRLRLAGLYDTPIGLAWREAVAAARPTALDNRQQTRLIFRPETVRARVFETPLARGMALRWRLSRTDPDSGHLFASLQYSDDRQASADWHTVATLHADGRPHQYTARDNGHYRLVFQPELGVPIQARLAIVRGGSLPFPVVGGHEYDIGGGFGAPRDGGKRRHKGVDIFADRDTAVRAVVDGRVSTGNGGLGGHYIFLSSGFIGPRFYYAHLDHFAVKSGMHVDAGQVIGYVGNSGNAAGGPTHLHFGVYVAGGAIDPAPFIRPMPNLPGD
ncbi:M23 family metallopeptidase [Salinisphaera hydrothermalis]|uniref:M23 family metallopeptidase n=1 Tax=Salinisphaera hydrothermalis TaxID=563188 RepID=UPI00334124FE